MGVLATMKQAPPLSSNVQGGGNWRGGIRAVSIAGAPTETSPTYINVALSPHLALPGDRQSLDVDNRCGRRPNEKSPDRISIVLIRGSSSEMQRFLGAPGLMRGPAPTAVSLACFPRPSSDSRAIGNELPTAYRFARSPYRFGVVDLACRVKTLKGFQRWPAPQDMRRLPINCGPSMGDALLCRE